MKDVFEGITKEDLTQDLQLLCEICGIDAIRALLREFSGLSFYIPKLSHFEEFIKRYIKLNSIKPIKLIAKDLNVSEQHLRNIKKKMLHN